MTTQEQATAGRRHRRPRDGEVIGLDGYATTPEDAARQEAEALNAGTEGAEGPPVGEGPDETPANPDDGINETSAGDDPGFPPANGRTSAGGDPQLQMDEVTLDIEEYLTLITHLEIMEANHQAKLRHDKAHREAWKIFKDQLGLGDGIAKAYRLRDFRLSWSDAEGELKYISFTRDPMQKVHVTRPTDA